MESPSGDHGVEFELKRKRSDTRSPSPPPARRHKADAPKQSTTETADAQDAPDVVDPEKEAKIVIAFKAERKATATTRGGGAYIPPHRLRAMMAEQESLDDEGTEYQRMTWEALRKSLNGLINKVNVANIKLIVPEVFGENLLRGRGLFVRSLMRAQASSLPFTPVFAALVAIINTQIPGIGRLLLSRLILQFRRSFKRNDKPTMTASTTFIAHLVNQQVAPPMLALELILLLLSQPTDDSVEIAVGFLKEVGAFLEASSGKMAAMVFDQLRVLLHESSIDKRVQYMVEVLFLVRKDKYKDNPTIPEGLDLVEEADGVVHEISLDDELQAEDTLNIFKFDPEFKKHEEEYEEMKKVILGEESEDDDGDTADDEEEEESDNEDEIAPADNGINADGTVDIHDHTGADLVSLRRQIYLTIMSALDFEEAVHKLLKIQLGPNQEGEMCNMIIECCSQERTYSKFFGLMGERFCKLNQVWTAGYEQSFATYYNTIHRYETNRLRNIARFFGHLLATDAVSWTVLDYIKMNEDDTTSSSRIFVKIMFTEIQEGIGLKKMVERFKDAELKPFLNNIFPLDKPQDTRFSINFFTSISLGAITEGMREHLKQMPALLMAQRAQQQSSDSDSSSSLSSSSLSDSSVSTRRSRGRSYTRSLSSRSRSRARSYSRSPSPRRRRSPSYTPRKDGRSPSPRRRNHTRSPSSRGRADTRSPSPRRRSYSRSPSRSRTPPRKRRSPTPDNSRRKTRRESPPRRPRRSPSPKRKSPSPKRDSAPTPVKDFRHPDRRFDDVPPPRNDRYDRNDRSGNRGGRGGYNNDRPRDNGYGARVKAA